MRLLKTPKKTYEEYEIMVPENDVEAVAIAELRLHRFTLEKRFAFIAGGIVTFLIFVLAAILAGGLT